MTTTMTGGIRARLVLVGSMEGGGFGARYGEQCPINVGRAYWNVGGDTV